MSAVLGKPFDWLVAPVAGFGPLAVLAWVSFVASLILVLVFGWISDQSAVERAKNRIKAHMLELRLFRHDVRVVWAAQKEIFRANLSYMKSVLKPFLVTLPVFAWFLIQMDGWFQNRPLHPGEATVVSLFLDETAVSLGTLPDVNITGDAGLRIETPALRTPSERRLDWRVRALKPGTSVINFEASGKTVRKRITVAEATRLARTAGTMGGGWETALMNSEEGPIKDSFFEKVEVDYPERIIDIWGWELNWLTVFLVLSLAFALLLKRPLKVTL